MPVRQRTRDLELVIEIDQPPAGEHRPQPVDHPLLQMREVPDRLVAHLAVLAVGAPQQRGLVLRPLVVATRDRYVNLPTTLCHKGIIPHQTRLVKPFSVYINQSNRNPIPENTGNRGSTPQK